MKEGSKIGVKPRQLGQEEVSDAAAIVQTLVGILLFIALLFGSFSGFGLANFLSLF